MVKVDEVTIREVDRLLAGVYGDRRWRRHAEPIDELIATVLSQHTNDINRDRAFRATQKAVSLVGASFASACSQDSIRN